MTLCLYSALACVIAVISVCSSPPAFAQQAPTRRERRKGADPNDKKYELSVDGITRKYLLYVPASLSKEKSIPLLLVFHGGGGHDYNMPRFTKFDELADAHGFIVAYPDSLNTHWNDGRELSPADDVGFVRALIAKVKGDFPVDSARIYATGISNGGFFSQRLACDLSDQISAVASVAATMPEPLISICRPAQPVSVMFIQGTDDPLVHIDGGAVAHTHGRNISLADSVKFWLEHNKITAKPEPSDLPSHDTNGTSVHRDVYTGGTRQSEVVVYTIRGGGHTWPGGSQYLPALFVGKVNHDISASEVIWNFLAGHKRE